LIEETLRLEEKRFTQTLERGLTLLDDELDTLDEGADLSGKAAFKLYDTYGFPLDLTQDALREKGRSVDVEGFDVAMSEQKAKARAAWSGTGEAADAAIWFDIADRHGTTEFLGYETEKAEAQCLAIIKDGREVSAAAKGDTVQIVVNQSPFFAESGGQVGDTGQMSGEGLSSRITDTKKVAGVFVHFAEITQGKLEAGTSVLLKLDHARRVNIKANHSATHLLHEALRRTLGDHVAQRGSLNAADRLRFDFSHSKPLSDDEVWQVEVEVNKYIRQNELVETRIMTPDDARALGAQALFGEKYGDEVRVVSMGQLEGSNKGNDASTYSLELCGGIHVRQTGDIGMFVTTGDSASSAGVRRIEGLTGQAAYQYLSDQRAVLGRAAANLKVHPSDVAERVKTLLDERKTLNNEVVQLRRDLAMAGGSLDTKGETGSKNINGIEFTALVLKGVSGKDLPALIDEYKSCLGSGAVLLIADAGGKVAVCAGVTADLTDRLSAVDLVKAVVPQVGGVGGGGRPDMARGGGNDISQADAAVRAAEGIIEGVN
jgi:alanyl-tRNA synthetase